MTVSNATIEAINEIISDDKNAEVVEKFVDSMMNWYQVDELISYKVRSFSPEGALAKMNNGGKRTAEVINDVFKMNGNFAPTPQKVMLRLSEVAQRWGRSYHYVWTLVQAGRIKYIRATHTYPIRRKKVYLVELSEADRVYNELVS